MNKCFFIGHLTADPDMRNTQGGKTVATFKIGVNRRFKNQNGETASDFFTIVAWDKLGEMCGKYLFKGSKVAVTGEMQTRSYEAKDGTKRYVTELRADEIEFLTPKDRANGYEPHPASTSAQTDTDGFTDVPDEPLPF
jgi:single-strand DNA-binding protein